MQKTDSLAFGLAEASFLAVRRLHEHLVNVVRPVVEQSLHADGNGERLDAYGLLLRSLGWAFSISRLNHPGDHQAVIAGNRALFEIAVDLALLHLDSVNYPRERFRAWEESAKLHAAEKIVAYYAKRGMPAPEEFTEQVAFAAAQKASIEAVRLRCWQTTKHPTNRWTGHTLEQDAAAATRLFPEGEFDLYYAGTYPMACWYTHGSSLTGHRLLDEDGVPAVMAMFLGDSRKRLASIAKLVLMDFRLWGAATEIPLRDALDEGTLHFLPVARKHAPGVLDDAQTRG